MPRTKKTAIASLPVIDLAYAVGRLIEAGKTTAAEVLALAADRAKRIARLRTELRVLRGGGFLAAPAVKPARPVAKKARKPVPTAAPAKPSSSLSAFRKLQGTYMGLLRNFTGTARNRIKGIAKARKFPGAIAEMKKLLAAKGTATKPAPKSPAGHKLHLSPQREVQLKLQGTYIGMMRNLPDAAKARLKAVAKEKGFAAAIKVLKQAAAR